MDNLTMRNVRQFNNCTTYNLKETVRPIMRPMTYVWTLDGL